MPKGGRKDKRRKQEEEEPSDDSMSVISTSSDMGAGFDDGIDESSSEEIMEEKLKAAIDDLTEKSAATRCKALQTLANTMSTLCRPGFFAERKITLTDGLLKSLRRGSGDEQVKAARCLSLLSIQLEEGDEEVLREGRPLLESIMVDPSARPETRATCATALGLMCFIAEEEMANISSVMKVFEAQFSGSYIKGDGGIPSVTGGSAALHAAALASYGLMLTVAPQRFVADSIDRILPQLPDLLQGKDLDVRCVAGESIALLYELARGQDEDFEGPEEDDLLVLLKDLATDGAKSRAKRDRRQQRANFRDILKSIEDHWAPQTQHKLTYPGHAVQQLTLSSWSEKIRYDSLCRLLGGGMDCHLKENMLLREIFQLGEPPVKLTQHERQENKMAEKYENAANFKLRTKLRAKSRDKRFVTGE